MLRGKSQLNVEWLGYSPGLLLERKQLLAGRAPRSPGRNESAFGMSNRDSYFYAAIVAVVAVHVVLALFVYVAWNEGSRQWREGKQD
ncbi:vacuolar ATPase assembly integral membrane protein VMA21 isoform X1 [Prionailurus iriomotensis]